MPPTAEQLDWLVMLYVAADDKPSTSKEEGLGKAFYGMLDRLKTKLPFDAKVQVVLLYDGQGDYGGQSIAVGERAENGEMVVLRDITQQLLEEHKKKPGGGGLQSVIFDHNDKLRINSGNWVTLREYVAWAIQAYPSTHSLLALVGHGAGLLTEIKDNEGDNAQLAAFAPKRDKIGGAAAPQKDKIGGAAAPQKDKTGGATGGSPSVLGLCPAYGDDQSATYILTHELGGALKEASERVGHAIDVLVLYACFMGMFEIAYQVHDYAKYIVAGQNILYAGLPYHQYIAALRPSDTNPVQPEAIAKQIVQLYNKDYHQESWAIAAVDASQLQPAAQEINAIAGALIKLIQADDSFITTFKIEGLNIRARIHAAYSAAQKFDANIDGRIASASESYVDLFDFFFFLREQLGLALADAHTNMKSHSSLIDDITAVNAPIEQLLQRIGDESRRTTAEVRGSTAVLYKSRQRTEPGPKSSSQQPSANLIARAHTQSRQNSHNYNLRHAYGLSIYLPLGNPPKMLDLYASETFLRFAGEVPQWVKLISTLTGVKLSGGEDDLRGLLDHADTYVIRQKLAP